MGTKQKSSGVLDGIRVLDFTQVLAGPYCTRMLADMGAEVIKVEPPNGEGFRYMAPIREGVSSSFLLLNCGKKSFCIDLKKEKAKEFIKQLVKSCDVVLENFAVGKMHSLGLDYEVLQKEKPDLIMCSITGYGQEGPNKNRLAFAPTIHADTGVTDLLSKGRVEDVVPGAQCISFADTIAGYHAVGAITSALFYKERRGKGQYIDISMYDSLLFTIDYHAQYYLMTQEPPPRIHGGLPIQGKDGRYIQIGYAKMDIVKRLFTCMGREDLKTDERFNCFTNISAHKFEFHEIVSQWVQSFETTDEVEAILIKANLPVSKIRTVVEAVQSLQVESHGLLAEVHHPRIGNIKVLNSPIRFSQSSCHLRSYAPDKGEHNDYVMKEILNLSQDDIALLYDQEILWKD